MEPELSCVSVSHPEMLWVQGGGRTGLGGRRGSLPLALRPVVDSSYTGRRLSGMTLTTPKMFTG